MLPVCMYLVSHALRHAPLYLCHHTGTFRSYHHGWHYWLHSFISQSHVREYNIAAKSAGALGARRKRLTSELLRYGIDGFTFVENEYYSWVRGSYHSVFAVNLTVGFFAFERNNNISVAVLRVYC